MPEEILEILLDGPPKQWSERILYAKATLRQRVLEAKLSKEQTLVSTGLIQVAQWFKNMEESRPTLMREIAQLSQNAIDRRNPISIHAYLK